MNLNQQLAIGEAKKQIAHYIVDCVTLRYSYENIALHNFVDNLSTMEISHTIAKAFRIW